MKKKLVDFKLTTPEDPVPWWEIGNRYITRQDLYLWDDAGENKKAWDDVLDSAKEHATPDEFGNAILNTGTQIFVGDIKNVNETYWLETPYGWICGKNPKITFVS